MTVWRWRCHKQEAQWIFTRFCLKARKPKDFLMSSLLNLCRLQILLGVIALLGLVTSGVKASVSNFAVRSSPLASVVYATCGWKLFFFPNCPPVHLLAGRNISRVMCVGSRSVSDRVCHSPTPISDCPDICALRGSGRLKWAIIM